MEKDFDRWNELQKQLDSSSRKLYFHVREIWWCSLGVNIGSEIDGKSDLFERPVIVVKVYNRTSLVVLPITSKEKNDVFHHKLFVKGKMVWVKLTQTKTVSSKRLLRKITSLDQVNFASLIKRWKESL